MRRPSPGRLWGRWGCRLLGLVEAATPGERIDLIGVPESRDGVEVELSDVAGGRAGELLLIGSTGLLCVEAHRGKAGGEQVPAQPSQMRGRGTQYDQR